MFFKVMHAGNIHTMLATFIPLPRYELVSDFKFNRLYIISENISYLDVF